MGIVTVKGAVMVLGRDFGSVGMNSEFCSTVGTDPLKSFMSDTSLSLPLFQQMFCYVHRMTRLEFQILQRVIGSIMVSMVNDFSRQKCSAKMFSHHHAVFKELLFASRNVDVPVGF